MLMQWDATSLMTCAKFQINAVERSVFDAATGQQLLQAMRSRLSDGFVEHSIRRLQGVI